MTRDFIGHEVAPFRSSRERERRLPTHVVIASFEEGGELMSERGGVEQNLRVDYEGLGER